MGTGELSPEAREKKNAYNAEYSKKSGYKAQRQYAARSIVQCNINLNVNTDADIIEHLKVVGNKQGYIKELIRKDMAEKKTSE